MDIKLGQKLINKLHQKGYLTLEELSEKRYELFKLEKERSLGIILEDKIENFLTSLPGSEVFLNELTINHEEDNRRKDKGESKLKNKLTFGEYLSLSILAPVLLFILFSFFAGYFSESFSSYYNRGNPFDFSVTWLVWIIYMFLGSLIELKIYKSYVSSEFFKNIQYEILFYFTIILTVISIIIFLGVLLIQYGDGEASQIAKSTKDGYIFYAFLLTFLAPSISWIIYYLVIKKGDALNKVTIDSRKMKDEKKQDEKRSEAVKQIKEAKELLDLGILTQAEYDKKIKKLKPIILNN
jgi:magnesium-transporting ATPase (P-type)|tara:strand:+ start:105 stop:992 length:888 start_codon:yes stop_codon:yes gene_type:complete